MSHRGSGARPPACGPGGNVTSKCLCSACIEQRRFNATRLRAFRRDNPLIIKKNNLHYSFGLSFDDWNSMLQSQEGVCKVCKQPEIVKNQHRTMSLSVDHDHKTGKVRGLLCQGCNRALGLLGDSAERAQALANYRRSHDC